jgi:hypothetical protein
VAAAEGHQGDDPDFQILSLDVLPQHPGENAGRDGIGAEDVLHGLPAAGEIAGHVPKVLPSPDLSLAGLGVEFPLLHSL